MSSSDKSKTANIKIAIVAVGVLASFGFMVMLVSDAFDLQSLEDRSYEGVFTADVIETRWSNLEEVSKAQADLTDQEKIDKALAGLAKSAATPTKTEFVVPGSPTFMKQAEAAAAAAEEPSKPKDEGSTGEVAGETDEPAETEEASQAEEPDKMPASKKEEKESTKPDSGAPKSAEKSEPKASPKAQKVDKGEPKAAPRTGPEKADAPEQPEKPKKQEGGDA